MVALGTALLNNVPAVYQRPTTLVLRVERIIKGATVIRDTRVMDIGVKWLKKKYRPKQLIVKILNVIKARLIYQ